MRAVEYPPITSGVRAAALVPEFDVISPHYLHRCGIADGTRRKWSAIQFAAQCGKGIYAMKPLAEDTFDRLDEALGSPQMEELASIAVGMRNQVEVEINVAF